MMLKQRIERALADRACETAVPGGTVSLRLATMEDSDAVYGWQTAPGARRWSRNPEPPTPQEHEAWMRDILSVSDRVLLVIQVNDMPSGTLRLDWCEEGGYAEVSVIVARETSCRGVGTAAVTLGMRLLDGVRVLAEVHPGNIASMRLFHKVGFVPLKGHWLRYGPGEDE